MLGVFTSAHGGRGSALLSGASGGANAVRMASMSSRVDGVAREVAASKAEVARELAANKAEMAVMRTDMEAVQRQMARLQSSVVLID